MPPREVSFFSFLSYLRFRSTERALKPAPCEELVARTYGPSAPHSLYLGSGPEVLVYKTRSKPREKIFRQFQSRVEAV